MTENAKYAKTEPVELNNLVNVQEQAFTKQNCIKNIYKRLLK